MWKNKATRISKSVLKKKITVGAISLLIFFSFPFFSVTTQGFSDVRGVLAGVAGNPGSNQVFTQRVVSIQRTSMYLFLQMPD